ncbi:MAG TPA: methylated-DNA--[protein]-cysteine S-methyltransferase [Acidimicrobiales bacterium]|nr:methylated-DNA--[protein]-cysteine S-methyltransferase [Acidimicrobiales bacterium]
MTANTFTSTLNTPIGELMLESDGDFLTGIWLPTSHRTSNGHRYDALPVLKNAAEQLDQYFARERSAFDLPTKLDGTEFQRDVWAELSRIAYGETITYGELARRVGRPQGFRAVGQANGKNPLPIIVPCHRVVASNGLGGYAGGLPMKRALLELESGRP